MQLENANVTIRANYNDEVLIIIDSKEKPVILNPEDYKIVGIILNDKCIYGQDNFMDKINNLFFTVSYNSFFQVNNYINSELFQTKSTISNGKYASIPMLLFSNCTMPYSILSAFLRIK